VTTPSSAAPAPSRGVLSGAAFLMAVSAIGPGFLTQTTQFTARLGASLACAILLSTLIDVGAQLNTWRIVCVSGRRGHQVAGAVVPGLGFVVTAVIVAGSFVFNLGNLAGCALGLEALLGLPHWLGASVSALGAAILFLLPRMLAGVDLFAKVLGAAMIVLTFYILLMTRPPLVEPLRQAIVPEQFDVAAVVTLVGGTVGGYIMFSGAHRLLDAGVCGHAHLGQVTRAAVLGILIAGLMRVVLFLAVLGVVRGGHPLSADRPVFDAFQAGAGRAGLVLSGLVFWAAAITSVVGCSYTSISFILPAARQRWRPHLLVGFIALSLAVSLALHFAGWRATPLLIVAGTVNGVLLPVVLAAVLVAAYRHDLVGSYRQPVWAALLGGCAWIATTLLACWTIAGML
jgi:Mn2+/Fe2+ NRAMP family transporter